MCIRDSSGTVLQGANFGGDDLYGVNFSGAFLTGAIFTGEQHGSFATFTSATTCPDRSAADPVTGCAAIP